MKNPFPNFFNIIFLVIVASCGSENHEVTSDVNSSLNSYASVSKDQFINTVLLKKCSAFKNRDIKRYSKCIIDTKMSLNSIDWAFFDSLKENQQDNILLPCNSSMIRSPAKFSLCINKQLIGFADLPIGIQENLNIAQVSKKKNDSLNLDAWTNIFDGANSNESILSGEEVFQMFEKSVFMILATNQSDDFSHQGSAVAVSGNMLFTNCHVVLDDENNPYEIIALANDSVDKNAWFSAVVFKMNSASDQCILQSTQKKDLLHIPIGRKSSDLNVGEQVMALGYPQAGDLNFDSKYRAPLTLSKGIISAIRDQTRVTQIQTDAFIINGSSGGALLDMKGNLIGITTSGFEGTQLNFAIAADEYENL
jgi:S1-C subfamily serine protease